MSIEFNMNQDTETTETYIWVRVGVVPKPMDRALDDLEENAIKLSLDQARAFATDIMDEVARAEESLAFLQNLHAKRNDFLSGIVLFGATELVVGVGNGRFLHVPLSVIPEVQALNDDARCEFSFQNQHSELAWKEHGIVLPVSKLRGLAVSEDDGDEPPK